MEIMENESLNKIGNMHQPGIEHACARSHDKSQMPIQKMFERRIERR